MTITVVFINLFALACLVFALVKDRAKAKRSLVVAVKSFVRILPAVLLIIVVIGLFLSFAPPERVARFIGEQAGVAEILAVSAAGAVLHIPAITSFPLAAFLLQRGAAIASVAAFPLAATLLKKSARVSSIVIFLPAWAWIKIPQELVELQFLGLEFLASRLALTIVFVIPMGLSVGKLIDRGSQH